MQRTLHPVELKEKKEYCMLFFLCQTSTVRFNDHGVPVSWQYAELVWQYAELVFLWFFFFEFLFFFPMQICLSVMRFYCEKALIDIVFCKSVPIVQSAREKLGKARSDGLLMLLWLTVKPWFWILQLGVEPLECILSFVLYYTLASVQQLVFMKFPTLPLPLTPLMCLAKLFKPSQHLVINNLVCAWKNHEVYEFINVLSVIMVLS